MKEKYSLIFFSFSDNLWPWFTSKRMEKSKHSFSSIALCSRMCSAAFSQVEHPPPCDYKYMYNCICTQREAGKRVLVPIYWRTFTFCIGPNSKATKLLDTPLQNLRRARGLRKALHSLSLALLRYPGSFCK
jgi:hypothetical protein